MPDAPELEAVMRYHERSKHHFNRFASGPGELDWANQPDPFRRYAGAVPGAPVDVRTLSRLLEYAHALSAWKQAGGTRRALRVNPSSGNLHPTEGYVLIGGIARWCFGYRGFEAAPGKAPRTPREARLCARKQPRLRAAPSREPKARPDGSA